MGYCVGINLICDFFRCRTGWPGQPGDYFQRAKRRTGNAAVHRRARAILCRSSARFAAAIASPAASCWRVLFLSLLQEVEMGRSP